MKKATYNTISFCSQLGNFAYAYPSTEDYSLTMKQILDSKSYTTLFCNSKEEAVKSANKMKTIVGIPVDGETVVKPCLDTVKLGQTFTFNDDKRKTKRVYFVISKSSFGVQYIDTVTGNLLQCDYNSRVTYYKAITIQPTHIDVKPSKEGSFLSKVFVGVEPLTTNTYGLSVEMCLKRFCDLYSVDRKDIFEITQYNCVKRLVILPLPTND